MVCPPASTCNPTLLLNYEFDSWICVNYSIKAEVTESEVI